MCTGLEPAAAAALAGTGTAAATAAGATTAGGLTAGGLTTGGGMAGAGSLAAGAGATEMGGGLLASELMAGAIPEATGMAGQIGSGFFSVPLTEGGAMTVGPGGALSFQGGGAFGSGAGTVGELGSGMAGITMPTAGEIAQPWYMQLFEKGKKGAEYYNKADKVMKLVSPQQQGGLIDPGPGTFEGKQRQSFADLGPMGQSSNEFARYLAEKKKRGFGGMNTGLLG